MLHSKPTDGAGGSGTTTNDNTAKDQPVGALVQPEDMPLQVEIISDIPDNRAVNDGGGRPEKPSSLAATEVCTKKLNV